MLRITTVELLIRAQLKRQPQQKMSGSLDFSAVAFIMRGSIIGLMLLSAFPAWGSQEADILFQTDPAVEKIRPDDGLVKMSFKILSKSGGEIDMAKVRIELDSPPKNAFFSTDFPIVEGTPLIRSECLASAGRLEINYLFPIRGAYRLKVVAEPVLEKSGQFTPTTREWTFTVHEKPSETGNLAILLSLLVVFGGVSGWVLGRSAHSHGQDIGAAKLQLP